MTAACYKGSKLIMTSLIIIKISFIYFSKDEVNGSYIRSHTRLHARLNAR